MESLGREPSCRTSLASGAEAGGIGHTLRCGTDCGTSELIKELVSHALLTLSGYARIARHQAGTSQSNSEWLSTTCERVLTAASALLAA
jgi:hypothetical protein